jgi:D-alanine-D-alanine ligase
LTDGFTFVKKSVQSAKILNLLFRIFVFNAKTLIFAEANMSLKIGLVYDLRKDYIAEGYPPEQVAEFDSEDTINQLEAAIKSLGYQTDRVGNCHKLCTRLAKGDRWDLVFNIAEGLYGRSREAQVPALLETFNVPYTFSDPLASAVTLDKNIAKRLVRDFGIPTAKFKLIENLEQLKHLTLEYPLFAKPVCEGTGKGIDDKSRVETPAQLTQVCQHLLNEFSQPVLVEEFLPGREFTVGVLGNGHEARVLGIMEIQMPDNNTGAIYSYEAKERCEELVRYVPYQKGSLQKTLEQLALKSHIALECRDASRVDFRCDSKGAPAFLEINPLPGLHPTHSDLPMIATQEGIAYSELIDSIIKNALARTDNKGHA